MCVCVFKFNPLIHNTLRRLQHKKLQLHHITASILLNEFVRSHILKKMRILLPNHICSNLSHSSMYKLYLDKIVKNSKTLRIFAALYIKKRPNFGSSERDVLISHHNLQLLSSNSVRLWPVVIIFLQNLRQPPSPGPNMRLKS